MPEPRLADRVPVACAGCFGQHDVLHVDFRTAFEGPQLPGEGGLRGQHVDWLILCESCVRQANSKLPDDDRAKQIDQLQRQLEQTTRRAEAAEDYASRLEDTLGHRPARDGEQRPARPKAAPRKSRYAPAT